MNANESWRERAAEALYGEAKAGAHGSLEGDAGMTPETAAAFEDLRGAKEALDAVCLPRVSIAPARLFGAIAAAHERSRRRWKRLALASGVAALVVISVAVSRLHVEVHPQRVVIAWGAVSPPSPTVPVPVPPSPRIDDPWPRLLHQEERLADLYELVSLLATERKAEDEARQVLAETLRRELQEGLLRQQRQLAVLQRDFRTLYEMQTPTISMLKGSR